MRRRTVGFALFLVLAAPFAPGRARACEPNIPQAHTIDPAQVGVDQTPPQLAQPTVAELQNNDTEGGCQPKCGSDHSARLTNLATDDMTHVDRIGYRVTLVAGAAPGLGTGLTGPVLADTQGLGLFWDGDDDFDFTVVVIAIDAAGNESTPRAVHITNGAGGCSVGHRRASDGFALAVLALALARGWRPSRRSRT
jgi:hypothetical protein